MEKVRLPHVSIISPNALAHFNQTLETQREVYAAISDRVTLLQEPPGGRSSFPYFSLLLLPSRETTDNGCQTREGATVAEASLSSSSFPTFQKTYSEEKEERTPETSKDPCWADVTRQAHLLSTSFSVDETDAVRRSTEVAQRRASSPSQPLSFCVEIEKILSSALEHLTSIRDQRRRVPPSFEGNDQEKKEDRKREKGEKNKSDQIRMESDFMQVEDGYQKASCSSSLSGLFSWETFDDSRKVDGGDVLWNEPPPLPGEPTAMATSTIKDPLFFLMDHSTARRRVLPNGEEYLFHLMDSLQRLRGLLGVLKGETESEERDAMTDEGRRNRTREKRCRAEVCSESEWWREWNRGIQQLLHASGLLFHDRFYPRVLLLLHLLSLSTSACPSVSTSAASLEPGGKGVETNREVFPSTSSPPTFVQPAGSKMEKDCPTEIQCQTTRERSGPSTPSTNAPHSRLRCTPSSRPGVVTPSPCDALHPSQMWEEVCFLSQVVVHWAQQVLVSLLRVWHAMRRKRKRKVMEDTDGDTAMKCNGDHPGYPPLYSIAWEAKTGHCGETQQHRRVKVGRPPILSHTEQPGQGTECWCTPRVSWSVRSVVLSSIWMEGGGIPMEE